MLKIDIEGYEPIALSSQGASKTMQANPICHILTEVAPWASKVADGEDAVFKYTKRLHNWGFECGTLGSRHAPTTEDAWRACENSMCMFDLYCSRIRENDSPSREHCNFRHHALAEGTVIMLHPVKMACPISEKQAFKIENGKRRPYNGLESFINDGKDFGDAVYITCIEMLALEEGPPVV